MRRRFRIAILCALLAVMWVGGLSQTSARAINPSELGQWLELPQAEDESSSTGVFGTYVTLTDP